VPLDKVTSAGNAAGTARAWRCATAAAREEIEKTVRRIEKIETAVEPRFQEHFVNANAIPHAVDPFPRLTGVVKLPERSMDTDAADGIELGAGRRRGGRRNRG
jgi:uncharacterized 2Fe-2S/4Fe-4S cluster protein (DUF4445 family)